VDGFGGHFTRIKKMEIAKAFWPNFLESNARAFDIKPRKPLKPVQQGQRSAL
jgi:hypothetical protein